MATNEQSAALAKQWRGHIDTWQASNLSQSEFCRLHELSYHRFHYWRQKFRDQERADQGGGFVSVTQPLDPTPSGLSIVLPGGLVVQGISVSNLPVVRQLLSQLS